jgi:hypothetical protein
MRRLATLVIAVLLLAGGTSFAQDRGDVSGGYRFMRSEGANFGKGWYFDVSGHVTEVVSIVGDVGGSYKSESETFSGITIEADAKVHTFAGGLKARASTVSPNVFPFAQVLFGVANARAEASGAGISLSESVTDPMLNLSGGVDVRGGGSVGVRAQIGWWRIFAEEDGFNAFHIGIGATIGF